MRTNIYYSFARHGIEIPWPIQVQYEREWEESDLRAPVVERSRLLSGVDLFAGLGEEMLAELAQASRVKTYGNGEAIVRQGEAGESMFVIGSGGATVVNSADASRSRFRPARDKARLKSHLERGSAPRRNSRNAAMRAVSKSLAISD